MKILLTPGNIKEVIKELKEYHLKPFSYFTTKTRTILTFKKEKGTTIDVDGTNEDCIQLMEKMKYCLDDFHPKFLKEN